MAESTLEKRLSKHARDLGIYTRKFVSPGNAAVPDRIYIYQQRVLFIELKARNKKPTEAQQFEIDQLSIGQGVVASWTDLFIEGAIWLNLLKQNKMDELREKCREKNFWQDSPL